MAIQRPHRRGKSVSPLFISLTLVAFIVVLYLASYLASTSSASVKNFVTGKRNLGRGLNDKYLYWGGRIDCPGKYCDTCQGLGHQESSLRCALEEALFLGRTFVMPSMMCINPMHNKKTIIHRSENMDSDESWMDGFCSMDSLYDIGLISNTVPVIMDNSEEWHQVLTTGMRLGTRGIANVQGVGRTDLKKISPYPNLLVINRTASPLSWQSFRFMECKDRKNRSSIILPDFFLPSMAAANLRNAAEKVKSILGDYDAIHVRRGDILKTRKDGYGVERSLHPHLDRDTQPEFILCRISKWVAAGRTLFVASNERKPGFFSPLGVRYKLAYSWNYSWVLDPVIKNNYQLFMVERIVMKGAKVLIKTYREEESDLSLTDDPKKNTKNWQVPVYTEEGT
ncbi:hypothetical protein M569_08351, partial [Genlisea aurea]